MRSFVAALLLAGCSSPGPREIPPYPADDPCHEAQGELATAGRLWAALGCDVDGGGGECEAAAGLMSDKARDVTILCAFGGRYP